MEFSRQESWSGLPFPSPEDLPNPGMEPWSPASQADSLPFELQGSVTGRPVFFFSGTLTWTTSDEPQFFSSVEGG